MTWVHLIGNLAPILILLGVVLKLHQRKRLPLLLVVGVVLLAVTMIPQAMLAVVGTERMQALLLDLFPVLNHPNRDPSSSYSVDNVDVGEVYLVVMQLSFLLPGIAAFVFALGFFRHSRAQVRLTQQIQLPESDVR